MYRQHAEKAANPAAGLAYAAFLGRQNRFTAALDICRGAWSKVPPAQVANACLSILELAAQNKEVQAEVDRQFQAALKKDPRSVVLRLSVANLRVLQRQYADAEEIFRRLIAESKRNALARNNYAWLLACQKERASEARQLIDEAVATAGPLALLLDTKALVCLAEDKPKEAVALLEKVVAEAPKEATYHFHLAQARLADGNHVGARRAVLEAQRVGLKASSLHPLERPGYERLKRALGLD
jgi:Tfp pilus assembly protein PilF